MSLPVGAEWHHLHLNASQPAAAARWYAEHLSGRAREASGLHLTNFHGPLLIWNGAADVAPSVGSTVDHLGFSVADLEATMERMLGDGATLLQEPTSVGENRLKIAFVDDPWGTKLELLEDAELVGFHHVHLLVPDPEAHRSWLTNALGGRAETFNGMLPGVRFERMWVLYRPSPEELEPTRGRGIDHLGFRVADVDAAAAALDGSGLALEAEPVSRGDLRLVFFAAPAGVRVELLQLPASQ